MARKVVHKNQLSLELRSGCSRGTIRCSSSGVNRPARLGALGLFSVAWSLLIIGRLVGLQLTDDSLRRSAMKQHVTAMNVAGERGPIVDRNGRSLAVSVPTSSVFVHPAQLVQRSDVIKKLARILNVSERDLQRRLEKDAPFVWVARQIPRALADEIEALKLKGVGSVLESKRYYPYGSAASTLLGVVGLDGNGLSGLEASYDAFLATDPLETVWKRDALGQPIALDAERFSVPRGRSLQLTLDANLQIIVDEELERGRAEANAKSGYAVLLDADTGDILALSHAPVLNLNRGGAPLKPEDIHSPLVESVFEAGSVLKPFVLAAALDAGVTRPSEVIDCQNGALRIGRHTINDVHPYDELSTKDILIRSSNIGMTKIGQRLGRERLAKALASFGFSESSGLGLAGESSGLLRPVARWADVDVATHSFGQGHAVTPLQLVRAMAAIANGGELPRLRLLANAPVERERILSEQAAAQIQEMLFGVVEDSHGTGQKASIEGVRVGGKTGTAQRVRERGKGYEPGAYIASFLGFVDGAPLGVPRRLSLLVSIDRPNAKTIYGGTLAAPVFRRIIQRTLHVLATEARLQPPESFEAGEKDGIRKVVYSS